MLETRPAQEGGQRSPEAGQDQVNSLPATIGGQGILPGFEELKLPKSFHCFGPVFCPCGGLGWWSSQWRGKVRCRLCSAVLGDQGWPGPATPEVVQAMLEVLNG